MIFWKSDIDLHIEENSCRIDYGDNWSSKQVHRLSKRQSSHRGTTQYGCEDTLELKSGVAQLRLLSEGIHMRVTPKSSIH